MRSVRLLIITSSFLLFACSQKVNLLGSQSDSISGKVTGISSSSVSNGALAACTSEKVKLYSIKDDGTEGDWIADTSVDGNGNFSFNGLASKGVNLGTSTTSVNYLLKFTCGADILNRLVTGTNGQNVDYGTTLLSWFSNTTDSAKIKNIALQALKEIYDQLQGAASVEDAYTQVLSNTSLQQSVVSSGLDISALNDAAPMLSSLTIPTALNEEASNILSALAHHWSPSYSLAYEWRLNGQLLANTLSHNYIPTANSQGAYTLQFFVGRNNGSGFIDTSKPFTQRAVAITVNNSVPPTAPLLTRLSALHTNSTSQSVRIATGATSGSTFYNCRSFDTFALVEDDSILLALPPTNHTLFTYSCTTLNQQDLVFTSSGHEGLRALRLWALDSAGQVSATPQEVLFNYDITDPTPTFSSPADNTHGNTGLTITGTCEAGLTVDIDGTGANATTATCGAGTFSAPITFTAGNGTKAVEISQTDAAGNAGFASRNFFRDSTPPIITIASPAADTPAQTGLTIDGSCEDGLTVTVNGTGISATSTPCASGVFSTAVTFTAGDGAKLVMVSQTDAAGNTGTNSRSFLRDTSPPTMSFAGSPAANSLAQYGVTLTGACEAGLTVSVAGTGANATTTTCPAGTYSVATTFTAGDGTKTISVSQTDAAGNTETLQRNFVRDTTAPVMNSVVVNNGDPSTSSVFINISAQATDTLSPEVYFKVGLANTGTESCQSEYADSGWSTAYSSGTPHTLSYTLSPVDGIKKICVWTKDSVGNISTISPDTGTNGVDFDAIDFFVGNPPVVTQFAVINDADETNNFTTGDVARISWTVTDVEGLSLNPITLEYTTDNENWLPVLTDYGGLGSNQVSYSHVYTGWSVPGAIGSGYFRFRIRAKDSSGNSSIITLSEPQNTNAWSVYSGSTERGVGGNSNALSLRFTWPTFNNYAAIDPNTNDIYVSDVHTGIIKISATTGATSYLIRHGTDNLSTTGGALPADPRMNTTYAQVLFDRNGLLYVRGSTHTDTSNKVYQINLQTMTSRMYLGANTSGIPGTSVTPASATWESIFVGFEGMAFDNNNNLYFFTYCRGNTSSVSATQMLLVKLSQNSGDRSPGALTEIAGSCAAALNAEPVYGQPALGQSITTGLMTNVNVAPNADGSAIYIRRDSKIIKILTDGTVAQTSIASSSGSGIAFNGAFDKILVSSNGLLRECSVNTTSVNGEVCTNLSTTASSANCTDDGQLLASACVYSRTQVGYTKTGNIYFLDNVTNNNGAYRLRYVDSDNRVRTLAGSLPFYGDGLHKSLAKGGFSSIYYKKSSEPELATFPEGLYFTTAEGPVFGRIDSAGATSVLWGNQIPKIGVTTGVVANKYEGMSAQGGYNIGVPMTFSEGLPWFNLEDRIYHLNSTKTISVHSVSSTTVFWDQLTDAQNPTAVGHRVFASTRHGFHMKEPGGVFILGSSWEPNSNVNGVEFPAIRYHNYGSSPFIQHITGGTGTTTGSPVTTPGDITAVSIDAGCQGAKAQCSYHFQENGVGSTDDAIYFNSGNVIRRVINPMNPTSATITNVFTPALPPLAITVSPNGLRLFYVANNGHLYCHALAAPDITSWCPQTAHPSLGPSPGLRVINSTNQIALTNIMTWKDDDNLFISAGKEIYLYKVPNGTP